MANIFEKYFSLLGVNKSSPKQLSTLIYAQIIA
jgi:hypothetical protein